jgi:hypothetical protein
MHALASLTNLELKRSYEMADADVISAAGSALEDKSLALMSFVEVCEGLDPGSEHRWVYVVGGLARALEEAVQAYVVAVNHRAMPHLRDLAAVTRPNGGLGSRSPLPPAAVQAYADTNGVPPGGMGAVAPMATRKVDSQLGNTRK